MMRHLFAFISAGVLVLGGSSEIFARGGGGGGHGGGGGGHGGGGHAYGGGYHGGAAYGGAYHAGYGGAYHSGYAYHNGYGGYRPYGYGGYGYRPYGYGGYGYGFGRGFGLGFGSGLGFGYFFSPGGYGYIPWASRGGYVSQASYSIPAYGNGTPYDDGTGNTYPPPNEWGLKITNLLDGPAKSADLRAGDVILGIGQTRTQTFEELQNALAASSGKIEVVFINGENKKVEKLQVTPVDHKIGVEVFPVDVQ